MKVRRSIQSCVIATSPRFHGCSSLVTSGCGWRMPRLRQAKGEGARLDYRVPMLDWQVWLIRCHTMCPWRRIWALLSRQWPCSRAPSSDHRSNERPAALHLPILAFTSQCRAGVSGHYRSRRCCDRHDYRYILQPAPNGECPSSVFGPSVTQGHSHLSQSRLRWGNDQVLAPCVALGRALLRRSATENRRLCRRTSDTKVPAKLRVVA